MKKIISILLTVSMLLSLFAVNISVSAEEVTIYNEIALSYTRDVMERRDLFQDNCVEVNDGVYSIKTDAWGLPSSVGTYNENSMAFNEDQFGNSGHFNINAENGYKNTINDIPYQFGVIESTTHGVADVPGNVIHSADFSGAINIPVDKAPYNNLYMIAWSGFTDNVAATITYNYTDGTTSTDANVNAILGGISNVTTTTDYVTQVPTGVVFETWGAVLKADTEKNAVTRNVRIMQHKLTPDSTKILESVTITTANEELNIFALTGATTEATVTGMLDTIKASFDGDEKLTTAELDQIEEDTPVLVEFLTANSIDEGTYAADIAALVAARRAEIAEEESTITEFDINNKIALSFTRDVMEDRTQCKTDNGAWTIAERATTDGYAFDEVDFIKVGATADNGYTATLNNIPYQFGVIESAVNGVADEPGNVIHSADFSGTINIPVDKAPYNNLYMIAWSGKTHNVAATITYNYSDGSYESEANVTTISGGTSGNTDTEFATRISFGTNAYCKIWIETTTSVPNARVFQHKLTPNSTKILESVTITTEGQEINIFALTGTTTSMVVKAKLDEIVDRFETEELTEEQLVQIEEDTKTLVDILKGYGIKPTYEAQIATLVADRREELAASARKENFDVRESTPIELNLFEDIFMGYDEYASNVASGTAEGSLYLYKGLTANGRILGTISYPQSTTRNTVAVAMVIENAKKTANAKTTVTSQVTAGKLVAKDDGRYDFTVAGTTYHLGEIATGKKTGNAFFPGQKYEVPTGETLNPAYTQDSSTKKVTSATYSINKAGLSSVNLLAATFKNQVANHTSNAHDYVSGEGRTELLPVTVTYSDGTSEIFYLVSGSTYVDFHKAIRVAVKDKEVVSDTVSLFYAGDTKTTADLVPVGASSNIGIDYLGKVFEINGKKLLMPKGSEILASINRLSQNMGNEGATGGYSTGNGYTYSYEIPVNSVNNTVASVTVDNPVSMTGYGFADFFGELSQDDPDYEDIVVGTSGTTYVKFTSDDTKDYYLAVYGENDASGTANDWTGIFAMTTVASSINDMINEIEAEVLKAQPDRNRINDLLTALRANQNFVYEEDLSAAAREVIETVSDEINLADNGDNTISLTANFTSVSSAVAIIAFYNENEDLITAKIQNVTNGDVFANVAKPEGTMLVKGFLWKGLDTLSPLAEEKSISYASSQSF